MLGVWSTDELIRQVTIESPERGLLLLRVRDEIRMTLDAYKTLYDSRCVVRPWLGVAAGSHGRHTRYDSVPLVVIFPDGVRVACLSCISVTFGVRKQLQAEQGMPELEAQVRERYAHLRVRRVPVERWLVGLRQVLTLRRFRVATGGALPGAEEGPGEHGRNSAKPSGGVCSRRHHSCAPPRTRRRSAVVGARRCSADATSLAMVPTSVAMPVSVGRPLKSDSTCSRFLMFACGCADG